MLVVSADEFWRPTVTQWVQIAWATLLEPEAAACTSLGQCFGSHDASPHRFAGKVIDQAPMASQFGHSLLGQIFQNGTLGHVQAIAENLPIAVV